MGRSQAWAPQTLRSSEIAPRRHPRSRPASRPLPPAFHLPPLARRRTALSCPGRAPRLSNRARAHGARECRLSSAAPAGGPLAQGCPRRSSRAPGPPCRCPRPPPFLPASAPNKLAPSTRVPARCKTLHGDPPGPPQRPQRSGLPTSRVPGRRLWGRGRRRAPDTHLTIEFPAGGAQLPRPRLLPAWAFCCRLCPSRPSPPPHPPPPPLLARQGIRRRRGGPAGGGGRRSWRRKSGRRALMARAVQRGGGEAARARVGRSSRHAEMRLQNTEGGDSKFLPGGGEAGAKEKHQVEPVTRQWQEGPVSSSSAGPEAPRGHCT